MAKRLKANAAKLHAQRFDLEAEVALGRRDTFAQAALIGGFRSFCADTTREAWQDYDDFAESCYRMAEAMLRERDKWNKTGRRK